MNKELIAVLIIVFITILLGAIATFALREPKEIIKQSNEFNVSANGKDWICEIKDGSVNQYSKCYSENKEAYLGELLC